MSSSSNSSNYNNSLGLPEDIIHEHILTRLPVKTLLRFRSVCKSWQTLISDPYFIKSHLMHKNNHDLLLLVKHHIFRGEYDDFLYGVDLSDHTISSITPIFLFESVNVVGSINGIVCLYKHNNFRGYIEVYLWNPATNQCKVTAPLKKDYKPLPDVSYGYNLSVGFGFDPVANDFKVIFVSVSSECNIYSSNADSWNQLARPSFRLPIDDSGVFRFDIIVDGCPYWIHKQYIQDSWWLQVDITLLDVQNEVFRLLPMLRFKDRYGRRYCCYRSKLSLVKYKDSIAVMLYLPGKTLLNKSIELYTLDERHGEWSKMIYVAGPIPLELRCSDRYSWFPTSRGEIVFEYNRKLLWYDPQTNAVKLIEQGYPSYNFKCEYRESLVFIEGMKQIERGDLNFFKKKWVKEQSISLMDLWSLDFS